MPAPSLIDELRWLRHHPDFAERPASIDEFLGENYLNIEKWVRPRIRLELSNILGEEVQADRIATYSEALITGGIGIGKTTIASIILPYLCHWVLCLKDPQAFFGLLPGSRIAFMQMSTSRTQALEVVFGDIKARVEHSKWFQENYQPDPTFKNQLRFSKDIWIIPGDSAETTFEGYNILGGILDEGDSHKVTVRAGGIVHKDYAEQGYTTISSRITSRFQDRGFLLVIGQMKMATGFMSRKYQEFRERTDAYAVRLSIWDSMGEEFYKKRGDNGTFTYDTLRLTILPPGVAKVLGDSRLVEVPNLYRRQFEQNPGKALRDLAGIPPKVGNPFIVLVDRILEARDRWVEHHGEGSPVDPKGHIAEWFRARDGLKRVAHVDLGYSPDGDALGFAMGHVREVVNIDGEMKPYIVIDMALRIHASVGREIFIGDIRHIIYELRDDRRFKLDRVTMDGFQSTDTFQQLQRRRYDTELVSIDRTLLPYSDLRDAIYERRIEFPPYLTEMIINGLPENVEIIVQELSELVDNGTKIDHPDRGSKDVADAIAGVTYSLMGDRRYHRKVRDLSAYRDNRPRQVVGMGVFTGNHPALAGDGGYRAPLPPSF